MRNFTINLLIHKKSFKSSKFDTLENGYEESTMAAITILPPMFKRTTPEGDIRYQQRLKKEYALIDKNQFAEVFLQVQTIMGFMYDIPHVIRGSAGSSLVCYLLGISASDPILHGLELARFMNDERKDMPDIDIDVPYNRRDELYARIAKAYPDRVARISNHVKYQKKSAIREALKQSGVKGRIPKNFKLHELTTDTNSILARAKELEGKERYTSLHCGGIVIFPGKVPANLVLKERIPLEADPTTTLCQIKLDKDETEDSGFIKIDLLSNRGIAQAIDICTMVGIGIWDPIPDDYIPLIRTLFAQGKTVGLTFGESRGMRRIFTDMHPKNINEIAIALALIRPAAAEGGRKRSFLTKYTEGTLPKSEADMPIVYDDDAIKRICAVLACPPAIGDRWRKAFAKQNDTKISEFQMELAMRGIDKGPKAKSLLADLNQLARYSFCKSHALSYAILVWHLAYLKVRYPHQFWVSTLNHCHSEYRKWVHMRSARCSGILIPRAHPPYKIGEKNGKLAIVPVKGEEEIIQLEPTDPAQILKDMLTYGYWLTRGFFPGSQFNIYEEGNEMLANFAGIVATGRITHGMTLLCIGVDNDRFIDLVVPGIKPYLFGSAVEGLGVYRGGLCETVQVIHIQTISYEAMIRKAKR